jgi:hypothetical protein
LSCPARPARANRGVAVDDGPPSSILFSWHVTHQLAPSVASPMRDRPDARNATDRSVGCTKSRRSLSSFSERGAGARVQRAGVVLVEARRPCFRDLSNGQRACRWSRSTSPEALAGSEPHPGLTRWLEAWTAGRFAYARPRLVIHDGRPSPGRRARLGSGWCGRSHSPPDGAGADESYGDISITPVVASWHEPRDCYRVGRGTGRAIAMPRTQPSCRGRADDRMARRMRKSNPVRSPSDAALLLL